MIETPPPVVCCRREPHRLRSRLWRPRVSGIVLNIVFAVRGCEPVDRTSIPLVTSGSARDAQAICLSIAYGITLSSALLVSSTVRSTSSIAAVTICYIVSGVAFMASRRTPSGL